MIITSRHKKEKIISNYLKNPHGVRLNGRKRFFTHKRKALEMVDAETDRRIGEALAEYKAGDYVTINQEDDILDILNNFDNLLKLQKTERENFVSVSD